MKYILSLFISLTLFSCAEKQVAPEFDIQGHRGARGHAPENMIEGFLLALDMGATTLEMDVVITKDNQVILSHEPWISAEICLGKDGDSIVDSLEKEFNIYEMTYDEISQFDCGSLRHPIFKEQALKSNSKPTLAAVIENAEKHAVDHNLPKPYYNIEIKSDELTDNLYHPDPETFVDLVLSVLKEKDITERTIIQSFDPRPLMVLNDIDPEIKTAYLTENQLGYRHNLTRLDFKPTIFSPDKIFVTQGMVDFFHNENIKVIPWTVNDTSKMRELIDLGVDGIITDYPDRLKAILK